MNKAVFFLLAILLISQYYCDDEDDDYLDKGDCNDKEDVSKVSECEKLDAGDYFKCCFVKTKDKDLGEHTSCEPITKENYDKIKDYIKQYKKDLKEEEGLSSVDVSINCGSNYIIISALSLILLLL